MKTNRMLALVVALLAVVAVAFYLRNDSSTLKQELSDFAVEDTASITRVFIADKQGNQVTLTREKPGRWLTGEGARADNGMINTLLETLKNMDVRSPVAKAAFNNVMKKMAATAVKVEIYRGEDSPKVLYVGHETQDQYGTFMYLENSSVPYVVHIPGFDGYLTSRFSPVSSDWVPNVVFDYSLDEISRLTSENREVPDASFEIRLDDGVYSLLSLPGRTPVEGASQNKMISYLSYFGKMYYEFTAKGLPDEKLDSIRATEPFLVLTLEQKDGGSRTVSMYRMPSSKSEEDLLDVGVVKTKPYDTDRFYVRIDGGEEMHAAQYYVFGKLFIKPSSLLENNPSQAP